MDAASVGSALAAKNVVNQEEAEYLHKTVGENHETQLVTVDCHPAYNWR